ncbi:Txe/YoeB family addiction module toxin [Ectothiorhodospiraceae bacterium BW-2]|nr:Txe/YoeB family addiction module toxin [Ectothiorhodospiraceae bacterium BW-2]
MYRLLLMKQAQKDAKKLASSGLKAITNRLLGLIAENPYGYPPGYEYLKGDLAGLISRRINRQHRLVYEVIESEKIIKVYRMWTHYE